MRAAMGVVNGGLERNQAAAMTLRETRKTTRPHQSAASREMNMWFRFRRECGAEATSGHSFAFRPFDADLPV